MCDSVFLTSPLLSEPYGDRLAARSGIEFRRGTPDVGFDRVLGYTMSAQARPCMLIGTTTFQLPDIRKDH